MLWMRIAALSVPPLCALLMSISYPQAAHAQDRDCLDFQYQEDAQAYFESKGGSPSNNVGLLDEDRDGIACEANPRRPRSTRPTQAPTIAPDRPSKPPSNNEDSGTGSEPSKPSPTNEDSGTGNQLWKWGATLGGVALVILGVRHQRAKPSHRDLKAIAPVINPLSVAPTLKPASVTKTATRFTVSELRSMPYKDYLQTDHWKAIRAQALARANYRCQVSNSTYRLQVHHRTYENLGNERPEDVVVLCEECHALYHKRGKLP